MKSMLKVYKLEEYYEKHMQQMNKNKDGDIGEAP